MSQVMPPKENMVEEFFTKNGKIICLELLKSDQNSINQWIMSQMEYREKLEKKQYEEAFEITRQRQLEMINQQINMWLNYCQTVEHTVKILEVDFLKCLKFDIDNWVEYQRLIYRCGYLESIIRTLNNLSK
jgi:predicted house-cleaning noncanonical NTP pyrophosphatase (MazG superfamily)